MSPHPALENVEMRLLLATAFACHCLLSLAYLEAQAAAMGFPLCKAFLTCVTLGRVPSERR